ncbi:MAG: Glu-tRNA(Gln) amidotransferase subunit GatD [archaeon]
MTDFKPGDRVIVETKEGSFEGVCMPSNDDNTVVLKLDSGYNVGVSKDKIKTTKTLRAAKTSKNIPAKVSLNKELKTISILHTGGTIASKVDYETGAVNAKFTPEEIVGMFPELKEIANIGSQLVSNMVSEDMRFEHYNALAEAVEREILGGADGVIITHGTDTLHYSSAALSFILENVPVPVVLVGAQRSSDRGSSDAAMNLLCAAEFIVKTDYAGVAVCMHKSESDDVCIIAPGTKVRKMHTSRRDAFKVINCGPLAEVDFRTRKITALEVPEKQEGKFAVKPIKGGLKVGLIYAHPQMFAKEFGCFDDFKGLVLAGTGLGHFPITESDDLTKENKKIFAAIKALAGKMPVVMAPQTIYGALQMNVYSPGRLIQEAGVLGNFSDMTPETTFVKLAWLLSNHPKEVKELITKNLRGELSSRSLPKHYGLEC